MTDTGRYHRVVEETPEAPEENGNGHGPPEVLDVHQVATALVELTKEVRHNRRTFEDADDRRWKVWAAETAERARQDELLRTELLGAVDETRGEVLRAVGELAKKIEATSDVARKQHDSFTTEHTTEITEVRTRIETLAAADARIEAAQVAEIAALKKADKALASRLRWRIGGIVSGLVSFGLALWKIFESLPR